MYSNSAANSSLGHVAVYNTSNGTVLVDQVYGDININNTELNRTLVGQRAYLQVLDHSYFKIVYTSRNTTTDSLTRINNRLVYIYNGQPLIKNEYNVAQINSSLVFNMSYATNLLVFLNTQQSVDSTTNITTTMVSQNLMT